MCGLLARGHPRCAKRDLSSRAAAFQGPGRQLVSSRAATWLPHVHLYTRTSAAALFCPAAHLADPPARDPVGVQDRRRGRLCRGGADPKRIQPGADPRRGVAGVWPLRESPRHAVSSAELAAEGPVLEYHFCMLVRLLGCHCMQAARCPTGAEILLGFAARERDPSHGPLSLRVGGPGGTPAAPPGPPVLQRQLREEARGGEEADAEARSNTD